MSFCMTNPTAAKRRQHKYAELAKAKSWQNPTVLKITLSQQILKIFSLIYSGKTLQGFILAKRNTSIYAKTGYM